MTNAIQPWKPNELETSLEQRGDRLDQLLAGTDIPRERFIGMTVQAVARSPRLMECDKQSVLLAVLTVAEMGLVPSGSFGGAWLVPYKGKAQPIIDWRGFIKMALRSGQIRAAWAHPVYDGDLFEVKLGDRPTLVHEPLLDQRGDLTHVYAVARLADGSTVFEVMTKDEVDAIRKRSRAAEDGPWVSDYVEMARKTVVRRLFKYLPVAVTPQLAAALEAEDRWEDEGKRPADVTPISDRRARVLKAVGVNVEAELETDTAPTETTGEAQQEAAPLDDEKGLPE